MPDERFGVLVICGQVLFYGRDQFRYAVKAAAPDPLFGYISKPGFHQIEPRRTRGRKVQREPGMPRQPSLTLGCLPIGGQKHDARPDGDALRRILGTDPGFQSSALLGR